MKKLDKYVIDRLSIELQVINTTFRNNELTQLTNFEKSIIYKYSEDGYESTNEKLRISNGKVIDEFAAYLISVLSKLPNYKSLCYRTATLNNFDLLKYCEAYQNSTSIIEHTFLSCSKSKLLAQYFKHDSIFIIKSKNAKEIENVSKFGINSGQNEKEVLFLANTKFNILEIICENEMTIITMEEN